MDARVEIIMLLKENGLPTSKIDSILYELCQSAPEKALGCFEKKK